MRKIFTRLNYIFGTWLFDIQHLNVNTYHIAIENPIHVLHAASV